MGDLDDYTYRGTMAVPEDPTNPLAGKWVETIERATRDGSCETVIALEGVVQVTRRTIDGSEYQQFSDSLLASATDMDPRMRTVLRGHWAVLADDPGSTCSQTELTNSVDLDSASTVGNSTVGGVEAVEYAATAKADRGVSLRIWVAADGVPLVLKTKVVALGQVFTTTLTSYNDGFSIEEPPSDLVLQPQA